MAHKSLLNTVQLDYFNKLPGNVKDILKMQVLQRYNKALQALKDPDKRYEFIKMQIANNWDPNDRSKSDLRCDGKRLDGSNCNMPLKYKFMCHDKVNDSLAGFSSFHLHTQAGISMDVVHEVELIAARALEVLDNKAQRYLRKMGQLKTDEEFLQNTELVHYLALKKPMLMKKAIFDQNVHVLMQDNYQVINDLNNVLRNLRRKIHRIERNCDYLKTEKEIGNFSERYPEQAKILFDQDCDLRDLLDCDDVKLNKYVQKLKKAKELSKKELEEARQERLNTLKGIVEYDRKVYGLPYNDDRDADEAQILKLRLIYQPNSTILDLLDIVGVKTIYSKADLQLWEMTKNLQKNSQIITAVGNLVMNKIDNVLAGYGLNDLTGYLIIYEMFNYGRSVLGNSILKTKAATLRGVKKIIRKRHDLFDFKEVKTIENINEAKLSQKVEVVYKVLTKMNYIKFNIDEFAWEFVKTKERVAI